MAVARVQGWLHHDAIGAWTLIGRDPIGVLLPAAAALMVEAALLYGLRTWGLPLVPLAEFAPLAGLVLLAIIVRWILQAPVRTAMIAAAARAQAVPAHAGVGATLSLLTVDVIRGLVALIAAALVGVPFGAMALGLASAELYLFGAFAASAGLILAALMALLARAALAYAAPEAVAGGRSPLAAIREGWYAGLGDWPQLAMLLLSGDVALGLGGAFCGAGALPGYPIADVAVLHRWARRRGGP